MFLKDVGSFFKELGQGVTGIVGGIGAGFQSTADYNAAIAAQMQANAAATKAAVVLDAERKRIEQRNTLIILIVVFAAPVVLVSIFLLLKKKG